MNNIDIAALAAEIATEADSLYKNTSAHRAQLLEFMAANEWFGLKYIIKGRSALITANDAEKFSGRLTLWLAAFKQPGSVKISLMLKQFENIYPSACALFRAFIKGKDINSSPAYWHLLDFLLTELDCDISGYSESEFEALAQTANNELTLKEARLLSDFFHFAKSTAKS